MPMSLNVAKMLGEQFDPKWTHASTKISFYQIHQITTY